MASLNDKILQGFDGGPGTSMILIGFQKRFWHNKDILFEKPHAIGFSEYNVKWLKPYLLDTVRSFC